MQVGLTQAGRARWRRIDAALRSHAEVALSKLSEQKHQAVHRGLVRLRQALERKT